MEEQASEILRNADTEVVILDGIVDYIFTEGRLPHDDELEDFIKNRLKIDLPVKECAEIIKRLKRKYRNQVGKLDGDSAVQDPLEEKLFHLSDLAWSTEDFSESDSEEDVERKKKQDLSEKADPQQLGLSCVGYDDFNSFKSTMEDPKPESLTSSFRVYDNPLPLLEEQFGCSMSESSDDLYSTFKNTLKEGPASILMSVVVEDAIPLAVLPPLQPPFNGEK